MMPLMKYQNTQDSRDAHSIQSVKYGNVQLIHPGHLHPDID
jgi:hypothetical protein